jgi:hypothetical protein
VKAPFFIPLWLCIASLLSGDPARAALTVELAAATATNPTGFLIESESLNEHPAANREAVNAAFALQLFNPNFAFADDIEIEATFSLTHENTGLAVELQSGGTSLVVTDSFVLGPRVRQGKQLDAALHPAAMLDPAVNHRVEALVRYREPGGIWSAPIGYPGSWRKWTHFINTAEDDESLNVIAYTGTLVLDDRQILQTAPGEESFKASLGMTLHRYDIESTPQEAAEVPVTFNLRLYDSGTLVEVPLENPTRTITRAVLARSAANPPDPVTDGWSQPLSFAPAAGAAIDPLANHILEVTVTTQEPDTSSIAAIPPLITTTPSRFLRLSGRLRFGGVETTFTQLANDPLPPMVLIDGVHATQLAVLQGSATAAPGRRYGNGVPLDVTYDPTTGDAQVTGGSQPLETPETDIVTLGGLRLIRGPMRLEPGGAILVSGGVIFPAGFGISATQNSLRHQPGLELPETLLNDDFSLPFDTTEVLPPPGQYFHAFCDRLPLRFRTDAITWDVNAGTFAFRQVPSADPADPAGPVLTRQFQEQTLAALAPLLADPDAAKRPSNDAYLNTISDLSPITIATGPQGQAMLTVQFDLGPGQMATHFPQGVTVTWSRGRFTVEQNEITGPNYLETPAPIAISYKRDCDGNCGTNAGPGQMIISPDHEQLVITADGGLAASGAITPERLRWGTTELKGGGSPPEGGLPYAHQTSQWDAGAFHAPGFHLAGSTSGDLAGDQRAAALLLSGVLPDGTYERPLTDAYRAGLADYAGLNLRVGTPGEKSGCSVLAGIITPDYDLKGRSKYYIRSGGVTGIHEAVALIPSNLKMYDFDVQLDGFRLAFRDGLNVESKTGGSIHVKSPVEPNPGFDLDFKELAFKCRGQPGKMRLATEGETKSMAYWGTDFTPLSMEFANPVTGAGCTSVDDGFLMVGVRTVFPSVTPQKLHATLGFVANGNLVTRANPLSNGLELDSRFTLPPSIQVLGAGGVPWEVTVTGRAYLNNPLPGGSAGPATTDQGFLTFPATINVPWFEDMKVQFHVSAASTANAASTVMHLMGGWPANPADGNGSGWEMGGANYFTNKFFDADHLAFPIGTTVTAYRDPATAAYNPRAQKRWLGVVDFDFSLEWDGTLRNFKSQTQQANLLVLGEVHRQVQSLSPSTAEITFGLKLDIPRVNTQSLTAAVKEGISGVVADALGDALGNVLKEQLGGGIIQMDALLGERLVDLWQPVIQAAADPLADAVLAGTPPSAELATLRTQLKTLPALGLETAVDERLEDGIEAIDAALAIVGTSGGRTLVDNLVRELLQRSDIPAVAGLAGGVVDSALAQVLPEIEPDLERAQEVLTRARASLVQARSLVASQVVAAFQETAPALDAAAAAAVADLNALVASHEWTLLDSMARRDRIRRLVSERVMACATVPKFQYIVRQHVQDTNHAFRAGIDTILGQVNQLMRAVIEQELGDSVLPQTENPAVGGMAARDASDSAKLAGINIEGYAQINDESLRVLDINGRFEFNIPDAMLVQAHLRIEEFDANSPASGCRGAGSSAAVVQIDARAECEWINTEPTIVEVGAKFSLQNGEPVGFDGYFAIQGEITLGPVVVNEARFLAGFGGFSGPGGSHWGYVGAKIRGRFNASEAAVGVFFGRTCDSGVIRTIDPQVGDALTKSGVGGTGPITGVYFYGEAWIPVNEVFGIPSTCLFTVRAGAGAGFFAFVSDPADGSRAFIGCKQMFGVEGRLLCIFGISGKMSILGAVATGGAPPTGAAASEGLYKQADNPVPPPGTAFILRGDGEFAAELGICPFCLELTKSISLTWTIGGPDAGMDIEL